MFSFVIAFVIYNYYLHIIIISNFRLQFPKRRMLSFMFYLLMLARYYHQKCIYYSSRIKREVWNINVFIQNKLQIFLIFRQTLEQATFT